jgi:hypothetical protein
VNEHSKGCGWWNDWHSCDCGLFDNSARYELIELLSIKDKVSYGSVVEIVRFGSQWLVKFESYFNPHSNPKSIYDFKTFDSQDLAVDFYLEKINSYENS